jgi:predicted lipoprotein with Yx(FWY)xxD motif
MKFVRERRSTMRKIKIALAAVLVTVAVTAAAAFASTRASTVSLQTTKVGKALVAANGRTLYLFTADKGRKSVCYGKCASVWPPLIAAHPTAGGGLHAPMLGTTKRRDGKLQVTYGGHPLYSFAKDAKPGDVRGEGIVHFGGSWWLISATGAEITTKP